MTQQRGTKVEVLIGEETTYGTAATTGFKMKVNSVTMNPTQNKTTPATLTGTRNPVQPSAGNKDVTGQIVVPVDSIAMWYWMQMLFGDPTTTGTGPYEHEFKVSDAIPSFTLELSDTDLTTDKYERYVGCKITNFSMDVGGDGELTATLGVMAAGFTLESAAFDSSPTAVSLGRLKNFQAALTEGASALDPATGFSISIDNGLDGDTFVIGGSGTRGAINEGIVKVEGSITMLLDDDAIGVLTKALASTESSAKVTITGGTSSIFEMEVEELEFGMAAPGLDGPGGRKVTVPFTSFYDNGTETSVVVARVTNNEEHA